MKRMMVILVVALVVGAIAFMIGHKAGQKKAMKAMNGAPVNGETEEEAETTT